MILKKGQDKFELPEYLEEKSARLYVYPDGDPQTVPGSSQRIVLQLPIYELVRDIEPGKTGAPDFFAVFNDYTARCTFMKIRPVPDKDYVARFRYCPKEKEL